MRRSRRCASGSSNRTCASKPMSPPNAGHFVADDKRVRQILFNLLANAIGFSAPGGRVTISARRANDMIEFAVADQGAGIPRDFIDSVFDRFASLPRGRGARRRRPRPVDRQELRRAPRRHGRDRVGGGQGRDRQCACPSGPFSAGRGRGEFAAVCLSRPMAEPFLTTTCSPTKRRRPLSPRTWRRSCGFGDVIGALRRPRRRQDHLRPRPHPRPRRRSRAGGAEPDLHAGPDLRHAAPDGLPFRPVSPGLGRRGRRDRPRSMRWPKAPRSSNGRSGRDGRLPGRPARHRFRDRRSGPAGRIAGGRIGAGGSNARAPRGPSSRAPASPRRTPFPMQGDASARRFERVLSGGRQRRPDGLAEAGGAAVARSAAPPSARRTSAPFVAVDAALRSACRRRRSSPPTGKRACC